MSFIIGFIVFFFGLSLLFTGHAIMGIVCILIGISLVTGKEGGD